MKTGYILVRATFGTFWLIVWVCGMVLAKGFFSTLFAIFTGGLWSAYLVAEKVLQLAGWV